MVGKFRHRLVLTLLCFCIGQGRIAALDLWVCGFPFAESLEVFPGVGWMGSFPLVSSDLGVHSPIDSHLWLPEAVHCL